MNAAALPSIPEVADLARRLMANVATVISGKPNQVRAAVTVLLGAGHLLIEDVPGVGKTVLAKALARSIDGRITRIQFTPDLLPSDVTGVSVFNQETREFEFKSGGIFANIVIGDEINRASPKTQSALLEAMAEGQVSIDGTPRGLPKPFLVVATQNPIEMEGTYPLPEAQRDRFLARISMGYPNRESEAEMISSRLRGDRLLQVQAVTNVSAVAAAIAAMQQVYIAPSVTNYIVDIVASTRNSPYLKLGASPRASLQLMRAVRVEAAISGRDYVIPEDVRNLAPLVLAHRVLLSSEAQVAGMSDRQLIRQLAANVTAPLQG